METTIETTETVDQIQTVNNEKNFNGDPEIQKWEKVWKSLPLRVQKAGLYSQPPGLSHPFLKKNEKYVLMTKQEVNDLKKQFACEIRGKMKRDEERKKRLEKMRIRQNLRRILKMPISNKPRLRNEELNYCLSKIRMKLTLFAKGEELYDTTLDEIITIKHVLDASIENFLKKKEF